MVRSNDGDDKDAKKGGEEEERADGDVCQYLGDVLGFTYGYKKQALGWMWV